MLGPFYSSMEVRAYPNIETVDFTGSTNSDLLERASQGAPEGLWLRAKSQGSGRGRNAREWVSNNGNIYTSTIIRLLPHDPPATNIAFVAANVLHQSIAQFLPDKNVLIKWPNDILVDNSKICGILLERNEDAIIMGTGVNLVHSPQNIDRAATSMTELGIDAPDPDEFMYILVENFAYWLRLWRENGFDIIRDYWLKNAHGKGQKIAHKDYVGHFDGIGNDGACLLRLADEEIISIYAGDIFMLD